MAFYRRRLPHLQRDNKRHFVTFCTFQRWILPEAGRTIVLECCRYDDDIRHFLHAAVVMPDHVHVIFTPLVDSQKWEFYSLAEIMARIKGASAQLVNRELETQGRVWQTESFDRVLRCSESLDAKIAYILANPVRAGLVSKWEEYRWIWVRRESCSDSAGLRHGGTAQGAVPT
jgi:REP element-mobilizing transposase RayT